jgi:hypothetical protein
MGKGVREARPTAWVLLDHTVGLVVWRSGIFLVFLGTLFCCFCSHFGSLQLMRCQTSIGCCKIGGLQKYRTIGALMILFVIRLKL